MSSSAVELKGVTYRYQGQEKPVIKNINLKIEKGSLVLITGASGSGKTTLSRCVNGLVPHFYEGDFSGEVYLNGENTAGFALRDFGHRVGSVFQDPQSQFFMTDTANEIAFGCVNMRLPREEVWRRTEESLKRIHAAGLAGRNLFRLSSGEAQKVSVAACYAMHPDIYVFDEPSANLDFRAVTKLQQVLTELKREGKTVIVLEHRVFYLAELLDRMIWLEEGEIRGDLNREEVLAMKGEELERKGLRNFRLEELLPVGGREMEPADRKPTLSLSHVSFSYGRKRRMQGEALLRSVSLEACGGEIIAVIGENGAGKTTLAKICCGLLRESAGTVVLRGQKIPWRKRSGEVYFVMQDSDYQLFGDSVLNELRIGAGNRNRDGTMDEALLKKMDLWEKRENHPATLSRGQKQRLTIAGALKAGSNILFFDEPTSGLDRGNMLRVAAEMKALAGEGRTVFVITHDYEFILAACRRILYLRDGEIQADFPLTGQSRYRVLHLLREGGDSSEI